MTSRAHPCCKHCPTPAKIGWPGHSGPCAWCQKEELIESLPKPPRPATIEPNTNPEEDTMTRFINRTEIKPGDTIRVTRDIKVDLIHPHTIGGATKIGHSGGPVGSIVLDDSAQIELVKRPLNLPTQRGSFVEVEVAWMKKSDQARMGHWILTDRDGKKLWVSATRVELTPEEFESFLSSPDLSYKVIR